MDNLRTGKLNLPTVKALSNWASVFGGFSAFAATILAFWAYFFTDIAEELTKQYNTEVSSLTEELIDLRRERRDLEVQASQLQNESDDLLNRLSILQQSFDDERANLRADLEILQREKSDMQAEIKNLADEGSRLSKKIQNLRDERDVSEEELLEVETSLNESKKENELLYVEYSRLKLNSIRYNLFFSLTFHYKTEAATAADLKNFALARETMSAVQAPDRNSPEDLERWSDEYGAAFSMFPASWHDWKYPDSSSEPPIEFSELSTTDGIAAFRHRLAKPARERTGRQFIEAGMAHIDFNSTSPDDRDRFFSAVAAFFQRHAAIVGKPITVALPKTASNDEVVTAGEQVLINIEKLSDVIEAMPDEVAELLRFSR